MNDGSMSGEEYLRRAAELNTKQDKLNHERAMLNAHEQRVQTAAIIDQHFLAKHFQRAVHWRPPLATIEIDYMQASNGNPAEWVDRRLDYTDVDLVIKSVHNLPTRARCAHPAAAGHHSATEPFRQQQETGDYPSLEDHLARRSVAFEPGLDEFGRFVARPLTPEEEHAIRTRSHRDTVQRST